MSSQPLEKTTSVLEKSPRLSRLGLTLMLIAMCAVPLVVLTVLYRVLPMAHQPILQAEVTLENCPPGDYYDAHFASRPAAPKNATLILHNNSDQSWTHIYLKINRTFSAENHQQSLEPGEFRAFMLNRFQTRMGDPLNLRYHAVEEVEVFAKMSDNRRGVFVKKFPAKPDRL